MLSECLVTNSSPLKCISRFDEETRVSILDLYTKVDAGVNPLEEVAEEGSEENSENPLDENDF